MTFTKGQTRELECDFSAPTRAVYWYKDSKPIINGTQGLYQTDDQLSDKKLRSTLHFPTVRPDYEGFYTCKADTSPDKGCQKYITQVLVHCKYCI